MEPIIQSIEHAALVAFLGGSMLSLGMRTRLRDLVAPIRNTRFVASAIALNFVLSPAWAWAVTAIIPLQPAHATGLLLLGAAAGAPFLPSLAEISGDQPAKAGALLLLLTAGTIVFLPVAMPALAPDVPARPWEIARPMILLILVPLVAGLIVRKAAPSTALAGAPLFAWIGKASMMLLIVMLIGINGPQILGVLGSGAIAAAVLYTAGLFLLCWLALRSQTASQGLVSLGTSARNFGAALIPASGGLHDPGIVIMIIVSAIVGIAFSFLEADWIRRHKESLHTTE